jgi:hypothetical protein
VGSAHAYLTISQRPESTEREHMSGQEGSAPQSPLDLEDTRVRYDTYHELDRLSKVVTDADAGDGVNWARATD